MGRKSKDKIIVIEVEIFSRIDKRDRRICIE